MRVTRAAWWCFREARPVVQVVFLLRFLVGAFFTGDSASLSWRLPVGALGWLCATLSVYLLNGVMDVTEDRANGSRRPIASGKLPLAWAAGATGLLAAASLALSLATPRSTPWVASFLLLGYVYSAPPWPAKRRSLPCAVVVTGLGLTAYGAGAQAGGGIDAGVAVFATAMSLWMGLVGAVVKDFGDAGGDAVGGRRTLAVRRGSRAARRFAVGGAALVGGGSVAAALLWAPEALAGVVPLVVGAAWVGARCLRPVDGGADRQAARGPYRAFMVTQYAANLTMLGAGLLWA